MAARRLLQLAGGQLQTAQPPQHPHPQVGKAHSHQRAFRLLHPPQGLSLQGRAGGHPGGKAGVGGLCRGEQTQFPAHAPHVRLGQPAQPQGAHHLQLRQRPHAGPVPRVIAGVGAVPYFGKAVRRGGACQRRKNHPLTIITALRPVGPHLFVLQRFCLQHPQLHPQLGAEALCVLQLKGRLKGAVHKIGLHPAARLHRRRQQQSGIGAPGKGQRRGLAPQKFLQFHPHTSNRQKNAAKAPPFAAWRGSRAFVAFFIVAY